MSTLAEFMIVAGAENRPPMLDKTMYNSWQSRMLLYLKGKKNGRMMLKSIENGPLVYPTIEENGLPPDVYALVNHCQAAKEIWDRVKLLMQGTELSYQERYDPIACLNKAMAFMSTIVASHFPSTNDQLRTSSNPRNQATIQDGNVTFQHVQGRQAGQARHCTKPKRPRNSAWFKEKMLLVQAQEDGQVLDEKQLAFLADPGIPYGQAIIVLLNLLRGGDFLHQAKHGHSNGDLSDGALTLPIRTIYFETTSTFSEINSFTYETSAARFCLIVMPA
ncbi:hypothetical protein Tco_1406991 [Tanacetum coccineum]